MLKKIQHSPEYHEIGQDLEAKTIRICPEHRI